MTWTGAALRATKSPPASEAVLESQNLRERLLTLILRVSAGLGVVVYLPSAYLAYRTRLLGLAALDSAALAAVFALLLSTRIAFRWRAIAACLIFYALGVGLLVSVGSISQIYLFGFSVAAVLLLGLRVGLCAALLSSLSLLAVGCLGHAAPEMAIPSLRSGFGGWIVITINFSLVNTLLTLAVGSVLNSVNDALAREISSRVSLDRERSLLRTLIDALPDVVFTKDSRGRFVNSNRATLSLFGFDREEQLAGKTVFDVFDSPEIADSHHAEDLGVMAGRSLLNREERSIDRHGNPAWYLTIKVPLLDANSNAGGLVAISRDITVLKEAEAERSRLAQLAEATRLEREVEKSQAERELREAEARKFVAEESSRAKSSFLAMMSHELRTPLNAIIGFTVVLLEGNSGATNELQSRYLNHVLNGGRHLLSLINSLLDMSKIEAGKLDVARQPCALRSIALEALATVQPLADAKQITLVSDSAETTALPVVVADPFRCRQIFFNLLSNSIKFTPKGGQVTVACTSSASGKKVRASILDTGPGIKHEDLDRLFKPYDQLEPTEMSALGGTGLGLVVCKQLAELMGGEVGVRSALGHGAEFFFELPTSATP